MSRDDDPAALEWIRSQAAKGAIVIGVCAGAKVVGAAGLLDGKRRQRTGIISRSPFALTAIVNRFAFWKQEQLGIELTPGVDEVSLALVADAWPRTYRSRAVTFAGTAGALETRNGIRIIPDRVATNWSTEHLLPAIGSGQPAKALDQALQGIAARYGMRTTDFVAMQLEHPRPSAPQ